MPYIASWGPGWGPETADDAVRPAVPHRPLRPPLTPVWDCDAGCGPWPCAPIRARMVASMPPIEISMLMAGYYKDAVTELVLPPTEVHRRLFGWINGPTPPEPRRGWHPPGGSI